jgi:hypothetical protein
MEWVVRAHSSADETDGDAARTGVAGSTELRGV